MTGTTIAVLPFVNTSDAEYEYFSDGITEEIISALARIDALSVISRTSSFYFKNQKLPLREIAAQLNASIILEGSVRIARDKARITAQLIHADEDVHFWTESWNRKLDDIFEIQDEVSVLIADKLREHLGHFEIGEHLLPKSTASLDAYQYCMKARYHFNKWNPADVQIALDLYHQATQRDPYYVDAYVGLADAYGFMATAEFMERDLGWQKASECIQKALALNPNDAGAYYQLANLAFFAECDFLSALNHTLKSLELRPRYPEALQFMAFLYTLCGSLKLANQHLELALAVNPLSQETLFFKAHLYYRSGETDNALKVLDACLRVNPYNTPAVVLKAYCLLITGRFDEVTTLLKEACDGTLTSDEYLGIECLTHVLLGEPKRIESSLIALRDKAGKHTAFIAHSYLFLSLCKLGKFDEAFEWLENCLKKKSSIFLLSYSDPLVNNLRKDPRYAQYHLKLYPNFDPKHEEPVAQKSALLDAATAESYTNKLVSFIEQESPYLNPALTLRALAELVQIHPNQLSWLINDRFGKNFNEMINGYRIEHFKKLAKDPSNRHISLVGLAYESGFNSKTAFNTFFKKSEGVTPSEFLKKGR